MRKKLKRLLLLAGSIVALVLVFQNCSSDMRSLNQGSTSLPNENSAGTRTDPIVPQQPVVPLPIPEATDEVSTKLPFPSPQSLLPKGEAYYDEVPDTLDLADRAQWFIRGATQSVLPSLYYSPAGLVLSSESSANPCTYNGFTAKPCLFAMPQNWGKVMQALAYAREMSAYDRDDKDKTLSTQHLMLNNMIDPKISEQLYSHGIGAPIHAGPDCKPACITPATVAMHAVMTEWDQNPTAARKSLLDHYVEIHYKARQPIAEQIGPQRIFNVFYGSKEKYVENSLGYVGQFWYPFINGRALMTLSEWYLRSGDVRALEMASELSEYILNYNNSEFWKSPDPSRFPDQAGFFAGHIHSWLVATRGLISHAKALRKKDPNSPLAHAELKHALEVYQFVKKQTRAGRVGNFGESGSTGDMVQLAILLTEQGMGYFYEEAEAWTRNALAEMQIDQAAAQYIPNYKGPVYEQTDIGAKAQGLFFPNGTHVLAQPLRTAGGTNDYPANSFAGMYAVWENTVVLKNNFAQINFLLNHSSRYLDILSELPYRGRVLLKTKSSLGSITSAGVRIPDWTNKTSVQVAALDSSGREYLLPAKDWGWIQGAPYVQIYQLVANVTYIVKFSVPITKETIYELRDMDQDWYEGSFAGNNVREKIISYSATFRGNTLVDVDRRPSGGIPRYQRKHLANLPSTDAVAPLVNKLRFASH